MHGIPEPAVPGLSFILSGRRWRVGRHISDRPDPLSVSERLDDQEITRPCVDVLGSARCSQQSGDDGAMHSRISDMHVLPNPVVGPRRPHAPMVGQRQTGVEVPRAEWSCRHRRWSPRKDFDATTRSAVRPSP